MPGVAGEHDPAGQRDGLAGQAVGVAAAVPALVLVAHGAGHLLEVRDAAQDLLADDRVPLHDRPLLVGQRPRARAGSRWGSPACRCRAASPPAPGAGARPCRRPIRQPTSTRHARGLGGVRARVLVAHVERRRQRHDHGLVALGQALLAAQPVQAQRHQRRVRLGQLELAGLGSARHGRRRPRRCPARARPTGAAAPTSRTAARRRRPAARNGSHLGSSWMSAVTIGAAAERRRRRRCPRGGRSRCRRWRP